MAFVRESGGLLFRCCWLVLGALPARSRPGGAVVPAWQPSAASLQLAVPGCPSLPRHPPSHSQPCTAVGEGAAAAAAAGAVALAQQQQQDGNGAASLASASLASSADEADAGAAALAAAAAAAPAVPQINRRCKRRRRELLEAAA